MAGAWDDIDEVDPEKVRHAREVAVGFVPRDESVQEEDHH